MKIHNKAKAKRYNKLVAKMADQSERLNRKNNASRLLEVAIAKAKDIKYSCAVKDKGFEPEYLKAKPVYSPVFIKHDRHGNAVVGSRLIGYVTTSTGIKRAVPCFRDGTPRFNINTESKESAI